MKKEFLAKNLKDTEKIAREVIKKMASESRNVLFLQGELGAGKTTFSQQVLRFLGARGPFTSPTFVIMKKYPLSKSGESQGFQTVYHLDCYRVESSDVLELGWQEIIGDPRNLVLVEWPERIEDIWPKEGEFLRVGFEILGEEERRISMEL